MQKMAKKHVLGDEFDSLEMLIVLEIHNISIMQIEGFQIGRENKIALGPLCVENYHGMYMCVLM